MKTILFFIAIIISLLGIGQEVYIPDSAFKAYLLSVPEINLDNNSEISIEEATGYCGAIEVSNLGISDLTGIEYFTSLVMLLCSSNNIMSLDLSNNVNIDHLECHFNNIGGLDLSSLNALRVLNCKNNNLSSLALPGGLVDLIAINNPGLFCICCDDTAAAQYWTSPECIDEHMCFDVDCSNLSISFSADSRIGYSPHTVEFACVPTNGISYLWNFGDGNMSNLSNPIHTYIDTGVYSVSLEIFIDSQLQTLTKEDYISVFENDSVSFINIPDPVFKDYLVNNEEININGDADISYEEAANFDGVINVIGYDVGDLTGIEAFNTLTELFCNSNLIFHLDVSNNVALTKLFCSGCMLTSLDVSNNLELRHLECSGNNLFSLVIGDNDNLEIIDCSENNLTSLDLRNALALEEVYCQYNYINYLDFSNNCFLNKLRCYNNDLFILDVRNTFLLAYINTNRLRAQNNPNLFCISVDSVESATNEWTFENESIDEQTTFSLNCAETCLQAIFYADNTVAQAPVMVNFINQSSGGEGQSFVWDFGDGDTSHQENPVHVYTDSGTYSVSLITTKENNSDTLTRINYINALENPEESIYIPDSAFKGVLLSERGINLNLDNEINYAEGALYKNNIDVSNKSIYELTGIEAFPSIKELICSNNNLSSLNLKKNMLLVYLNCENNDLHYLDVRNTMLKTRNSLYAQYNDDLACISVDDPVWSYENWTFANGNVDSEVVFSSDCQNSTQINNLSLRKKYFEIFPNPSNGVFSIVLEDTMMISVFSQLGETVFEYRYNEGKHIIDLSNFENGLYILKASNKNIEFHRLLIKL